VWRMWARGSTPPQEVPSILPHVLPPARPSTECSETWAFMNYALPVTNEAIALSVVSRSLKSKNESP